MQTLSPQQVRLIRTRAQTLHSPAPRESLLDVVRAVIGVQAQSHPALQLALRMRLRDLTLADVESALRERDVIRTWTMRSTIHLSTPEDTRMLIGLLGPMFESAARGRRRGLGLDDETAARGVALIRDILGERGPLSRDDLVIALNERSMELERRSQGPIHLIGLAAFQGVACFGPHTGIGDETFARFDSWVGEVGTQSQDEALAELARRYVRGYSPASDRDFAAWAGITLTHARRGWAALSEDAAFTEVEVEGASMQVAVDALDVLDQPASPAPIVRLLPTFDNYLLGYKDRSLILAPSVYGEVFHGGQIVPAVLVDGEVIGVWRYQRKGKRLAITARAFADSFSDAVRQGIAEEVDDIGRFWAMEVSLDRDLS